ncbi:hypothetical protein [Mucilaginibacter lacusdianchii]|uniref:hypothetical protein n=1 Tax=Mucilaginibacter lacusdianchii TaxID=2684211 RepID=UPI0018EEF234|nr:hypothetical protein [Mucilaginibacter sp. JXJ CY 39]
MKKSIVFSFVLLFLGIKTYAQHSVLASDTTLQQSYKSKYLSTHKTLKTVGWVSLGTGVPLVVLGLLYEIGSINSSNGKGLEKTGNWMMASGAGLTVASIPCFIISHHYKKKAASLSLGNQQVFIPQQYGFISRIQPALYLRIPL